MASLTPSSLLINCGHLFRLNDLYIAHRMSTDRFRMQLTGLANGLHSLGPSIKQTVISIYLPFICAVYIVPNILN